MKFSYYQTQKKLEELRDLTIDQIVELLLTLEDRVETLEFEAAEMQHTVDQYHAILLESEGKVKPEDLAKA